MPSSPSLWRRLGRWLKGPPPPPTPLPPLLPPLQAILDAELAAGNQVAQTASWPPNLELTVLLRYHFGRRYEPPGVRYSVTNDPHYWYAEYTYHEAGHQQLLGCGFEELPPPVKPG